MINIRCTDSTQAMAWVLFFCMKGMRMIKKTSILFRIKIRLNIKKFNIILTFDNCRDIILSGI